MATKLKLDDIEYFEEIELDEVYDISVEDNECYYLDNEILVHNSSKTYSTCQYLFYLCLIKKDIIITIARDSLVVNKRTVFLDFQEIVKKSEIKYKFNKSEMIYYINDNTVRFVGLDDINKVHGLKQHYCYINEGLEIDKNIYNQLLQRTENQMIIDYNPSSLKHFLYEWGDNRDDCKLLKTNIFDNPLAPKASVDQILSYEPTEYNKKQGTANEFYWRVFGLGERFRGNDVVIRKYNMYDYEISDEDIDWTVFGGDFGYVNDPTALLKVQKLKNSNKLFCKCLIYQTGLNNRQLYNKIKSLKDFDENLIFIFDSAEMKSINELYEYGLYIEPAKKGKGSVYYSTQKLQQLEINIFDDDLGRMFQYELENLRYKVNSEGVILKNSMNQPILKQSDDHFFDCLRYVVNTINI